jgi:hydroxyacylglutathione hydrolase
MPALEVSAFVAAIDRGAIPLDLRSPVQYAAAHIACSVLLQFGRQDLGDRAELYLDKSDPYVLLMEPAPLGPVAEKLLAGAGYQVAGYLQGGLKSWSEAGLPVRTMATGTVQELQSKLAAGESVPLIDVREDFEFDWAHIDGAVNLPHGEIWERGAQLDHERPWYVICNDQVRSGAAAGMLERLGFRQLTLVLGGTAAWLEAGYPVIKAG